MIKTPNEKTQLLTQNSEVSVDTKLLISEITLTDYLGKTLQSIQDLRQFQNPDKAFVNDQRSDPETLDTDHDDRTKYKNLSNETLGLLAIANELFDDGAKKKFLRETLSDHMIPENVKAEFFWAMTAHRDVKSGNDDEDLINPIANFSGNIINQLVTRKEGNEANEANEANEVEPTLEITYSDFDARFEKYKNLDFQNPKDYDSLIATIQSPHNVIDDFERKMYTSLLGDKKQLLIESIVKRAKNEQDKKNYILQKIEVINSNFVTEMKAIEIKINNILDIKNLSARQKDQLILEALAEFKPAFERTPTYLTVVQSNKRLSEQLNIYLGMSNVNPDVIKTLSTAQQMLSQTLANYDNPEKLVQALKTKLASIKYAKRNRGRGNNISINLIPNSQEATQRIEARKKVASQKVAEMLAKQEYSYSQVEETFNSSLLSRLVESINPESTYETNSEALKQVIINFKDSKIFQITQKTYSKKTAQEFLKRYINQFTKEQYPQIIKSHKQYSNTKLTINKFEFKGLMPNDIVGVLNTPVKTIFDSLIARVNRVADLFGKK